MFELIIQLTACSTIDQLRELYHAVKKTTKKREGEVSYYHEAEEDGQLGLVHFP